MLHYTKIQNLPYSKDDIRKMTAQCKVCNECKPRFVKSSDMYIVQATKPFGRLNVAFKGPIPSSTIKKYFLTIVDEYSRFPAVFPCTDTSAQTLLKYFRQ